jgi:hypothetical protein
MMRYVIAIWLALCVSASAQGIPLFGAGSTAPVAAAACGGFTGAGDIYGVWKAYYGARSYSAATCGNALFDVCNSTGGVDVGCGTLHSSASTGALVPATIGGITCPTSTSVCTITKAYDLTAGGNCAGSCDQIGSAGTIANRPVLTTTCSSPLTLCVKSLAAGTPILESAGNMSLTETYGIMAVGTVSAANSGFIAFAGVGSAAIQDGSSSNTVGLTCDSSSYSIPTAADGTWFSFLISCSTNIKGDCLALPEW